MQQYYMTIVSEILAAADMGIFVGADVGKYLFAP